MTVTIDLTSLPAELREAGRRLGSAAVNAMRGAAMMSLGHIQESINETAPYVPVDTGQYRQAWQVEHVLGGADLFNPTIQASIIEYGSRPHTAPIGPLLDWAERKLRSGGVPRTPTPVSMGRRLKRAVRRVVKKIGRRLGGPSQGRSRSGVTRTITASKEVQDLAFRAWVKIREDGTDAKRVMERARPQMLRAVELEIERVTRRVVEGRRR